MTNRRRLVITVVLCCLGASAAAQDGELDPGFGNGGVQVTDLRDYDYGYDAIVLDDGRIVVAGVTQGSSPTNRDAVMLHYQADGTFDSAQYYSRSQSGCGSVPEAFYAFAEEADGRLLAGGYAQFDCSGSDRDFWIVRTESSGHELQRFDRPTFYGVMENLRDILVQPDGKVVAVGFAGPSAIDTATWDFAIARYNADGTLDTAGFGVDGEVVVDVAGDYDFSFSGALQADGKIVAVGYAANGGQFDIAVVRLNADGTTDPTFGTNGVVTTDFVNTDEFAADIVVQPDGKLVVVGSRQNAGDTAYELIVVRYESSGLLDTTFGTGGVVVIDLGGASASGTNVLVDPVDRIVVVGTVTGPGGDTTRDFAVARVNQDGGLDPSFSGDGTQVFGIVPGQEDGPIGVAVQPQDGAVVVVGYTVEVVGVDEFSDFAVARLLGGGVVFADGFESGDTSHWSLATGG